MKTNFKDIDFPDNTLSPSEKHENANGWDLDWNYTNLVSGYQIAMTMPEKLQPGPLAGRISFFAPVSLFFFFFLMLIITTMRGIDLHPMNYFFLAAAFFSFHLLLAYLVDHISIHLAFVICSAVSIFLVISYLRLVVGLRFAMREAALSQFIYLVAFSYAFLPERIHRARDHDWLNQHAFCRDASDGENSLAGTVQAAATTGAIGAAVTFTCVCRIIGSYGRPTILNSKATLSATRTMP
jgi:hypothetical protein